MNLTDDVRDTAISLASSCVWFDARLWFIFGVKFQCGIGAGAGYGGVDSETIRELIRKCHFQMKIQRAKLITSTRLTRPIVGGSLLKCGVAAIFWIVHITPEQLPAWISFSLEYLPSTEHIYREATVDWAHEVIFALTSGLAVKTHVCVICLVHIVVALAYSCFWHTWFDVWNIRDINLPSVWSSKFGIIIIRRGYLNISSRICAIKVVRNNWLSRQLRMTNDNASKRDKSEEMEQSQNFLGDVILDVNTCCERLPLNTDKHWHSKGMNAPMVINFLRLHARSTQHVDIAYRHRCIAF